LLPARRGRAITAASANNSTAPKNATVSCPAGKQEIAGGAELVGNSNVLGFASSYPLGGGAGTPPTGWTATGREISNFTGAWLVRVYVTCAFTS
jgi:hypothetical protein